MENEPTKTKVWSPTTVGIVSLLMAFPAGALLATINAHRLGNTKSKRKYIVNGILFVIAFLFMFIQPFSGAAGLTGIAGIFLAIWIHNNTKEEIETYLKENETSLIYKTWWTGALLGLLTWITFALLIFAFVLFQYVFQYPTT